jgi:ribosomal protein S18 acetylase RimI-like enzyme
MPHEILRATAEHLDVLAALFDAYRRFYGCAEDLPAARAFLAERIAHGESIIFLALLDGKPVGFTQLYPTFTSIGIRRAWILNDLYVSPEARRNGVGGQLMEAARKMAIETRAAWVELATAKDNDTAQSLYRNCGYRKDEVYDRFKLELKASEAA